MSLAAGEAGPPGPSPGLPPDLPPGLPIDGGGDEVPELRPAARRQWATYVLTRALFLRLLGGIYVMAFLSLARQVMPLLGGHGISPAARFLDRVAAAQGSRWDGFLALPTLFWLGCPDALLQALAWAGVALGGAVVLGVGNALVMAVLWALYLSFTHVGQIFYGFGWESLTLETGFLAIFLCPLGRLRPGAMEPPRVVIYLLRWLLFRVVLGAGLIKIRGDECWRDLTCLFYHYQTQPLPNPLSWLLHQSPPWFHRGEVLWNHFIELVAPWMLLWPRRLVRAGGLLQIAFQLTLVASGNLSWLNWLTITIAISCLDDELLLRLAPGRLRERLRAAIAKVRPHRSARYCAWALLAVVGILSINPIANLISPEQVMNTGFDPLQLVNTYGAFGHIGRARPEVILEGTDAQHIDDTTVWREYQLPCKPGDPARRPCFVAPYQPRLDWEIWFAAMSDYQQHPWLVRFAYKLLRGDPAMRTLLAVDPFPDHPPRYIRARLFEYEFTRLGDHSRDWWRRRYVSEYLPPLALDDPSLPTFLEANGFPVD